MIASPRMVSLLPSRLVDSLEILAGLIHPELFEEFLADKAWAYQQRASSWRVVSRVGGVYAAANDHDDISGYRAGMPALLHDLSLCGRRDPAQVSLVWPRYCGVGGTCRDSAEAETAPARTISAFSRTFRRGG